MFWVQTETRSHLQKHSEEDDGDGGSDEELLAADGVGQSEGQGEGDRASQAAVSQAKLILQVERDGAERVNDLSQYQDAWEEEQRLLFRRCVVRHFHI